MMLVRRLLLQRTTAVSCRRLLTTIESQSTGTTGERHIFDRLRQELAPTKLAVTDSSGGCGSMYVVEIEAECFRGLTRVKQTKLVNALLKEELKEMHGMRVDRAYQARTSSGGVLSVLALLAVVVMLASETRDYLRYQHTHSFTIDSEVQQKVQINLGLTVAMPCNFLRVDVLDASGTSENVHSSITTRPVSQRLEFTGIGGQPRSVNQAADLHVHDIFAQANKRRRKNASTADGKGTACRIEGSVLVSKVAGLLHVTAHGHGHGGAYVPRHMLNFTHHIDELSFGPLYPSLVNPLDDTLHFANHSLAAFRYFISVVPTLYIDSAGRRLPTNQYAVNEYYKAKTDTADADGKPPGVFLEYSFESIAITIREHRASLLVFLVRVCAAVSGFFVTIGLVHRLVVSVTESVFGSKSGGTKAPVGILDSKHPSRADIDVPSTNVTSRR
ncbi:hypothetical protein GGI19_003609 [Coemansia pectinata]|uniref:Uncharacterized protein n=1 Tax=Coemansia pectinata TaxID=1052879 RepID=A0A9W8LB38_9FUNG|nr:hypothetical protein GGI19_003609 [Coemansia pectinata]